MAGSMDTGDLGALAASFGRAAGRALDGAEVVVTKTMQDITGDGRASAAVDTGFLRSSIGYDVARDDTGVTGESGPSAHYGGHIERGTSRVGPRPYMAPAFDRRLPGCEAALAQLAGDALG